MFDEYFKSPSVVSTPISAATPLLPDTAGASSSTSIDQDAHSPSISLNIKAINSPVNSTNVETDEEVVVFNSDTFTNPFSPLNTSSAESSSRIIDTSNMHTFKQPPIYTKRWTKDHLTVKTSKDPNETPVDPTRYRGMVRSLMYLTASRPDLVFVVFMCAWYQDTSFNLRAFADADHVGCQDSRKSTSGSAQFLGEKLEQSKEEVRETMTETMEQYMRKIRGDYVLGVTRPAINQDTQFELKGQFLKELYDNTFTGLEHEDANEHIKKVIKIVDLFHIPKITQDQIMLRAFPVSLTGAFYNGVDVPTRQIMDSKSVIPFKTAADATVAIQEMVEFSQK
nr:hypothetical protein [Tanacetum cinerariifolium]GEW62366.1 hypothetical protein [Tanacetum cinerariifolium]